MTIYLVLQSVVKDAAARRVLRTRGGDAVGPAAAQSARADGSGDDAAELQHALQSLRAQGITRQSIEVPVELVERAASIESAQIARSVGTPSSRGRAPEHGYAITFDETATRQRAALSMADRLALEDLLADLSTGAAPGLASPASTDGREYPAELRASDAHVELVYTADTASKVIRVHGLKARSGAAEPVPAGGGDA